MSLLVQNKCIELAKADQKLDVKPDFTKYQRNFKLWRGDGIGFEDERYFDENGEYHSKVLEGVSLKRDWIWPENGKYPSDIEVYHIWEGQARSLSTHNRCTHRSKVYRCREFHTLLSHP